MKNFKFLVITLLIFSVTSTFAQEKYLSTAETPSEIKTYVEQHFSQEKLVYVESERKLLSKKYTAKLNNGVEIDFDDEFQPYEIESKNGLPDSVLPNSIVQYVSRNFPSEKVKEWKREKRKQSVELSNGIDLEFDNQGNFIKID
ncbi:MAG: hypothetical protein GX163_09740 [Bacteroidetes bacterium]|nr:hypothetical protein [Bacteroidota bacterium]